MDAMCLYRLRRSWYLPGLAYDLAFAYMLRSIRKRVLRIVDWNRLFPWIDICSGTGDQLRILSGEDASSESVPILDSTSTIWPVSDHRLKDYCGRETQASRLSVGLDKHFGFVRYAAARAPGVPFVCGDAAFLPFKDGSIRAVSISFGLHDKSPNLRRAIIQEARRALASDGKLIAVDFERPWSAKSRAGALFAHAIERLAPREHYRNGREFLRRGGMRAFLSKNGFVEDERSDIEAGSLAIVVARPAD